MIVCDQNVYRTSMPIGAGPIRGVPIHYLLLHAASFSTVESELPAGCRAPGSILSRVLPPASAPFRGSPPALCHSFRVPDGTAFQKSQNLFRRLQRLVEDYPIFGRGVPEHGALHYACAR